MKPRKLPRRCLAGRARRFLCGLRLILLLLILAGSAAGFYLNQVGLPESLSTSLRLELRKRGLDLDFEKVRLRGFRTFSAENIRFQSSSSKNPIRAQSRTGEVRVSWRDLLRLQVIPEAFSFRSGSLELPLLDPRKGVADATVRGIELAIRFLPADRWELSDFRGTLFNIQVQASGSIEHASSMGTFRKSEPGLESPALESRLRDWVRWIREWDFADSSEISVRFQADASNAANSEVSVKLRVPEVNTRGWNLKNLQGEARFSPDAANESIANLTTEIRCLELTTDFGRLREMTLSATGNGQRSEISLNRIDWVLEVASADWENGNSEGFHASGATTRSSSADSKAATTLTLALQNIDAGWMRAKTSRLDAELFHSRTDGFSISGDWHWKADHVFSGAIESNGVDFSGKIQWPAPTPEQVQTELVAHVRDPLRLARLNWTGKVSDLQANGVNLGEFELTGGWNPPDWSANLTHSESTGHVLTASASMNMLRREVAVSLESNLDIHPTAALLPAKARDLLEDFIWAAPPIVKASARFTIPKNTAGESSGLESILSSLSLSGDISLGNGSFLRIPISRAGSEFFYTNSVWNFPNLQWVSQASETELGYRINSETGEFSWSLNGQIFPDDLRPLLPEASLPRIDLFEFREALNVDGEGWGQWREPERSSASARISTSNFSFRGEPCEQLATTVSLKDSLLVFRDLSIIRKDGTISGDEVRVDPDGTSVTVKNVVSTMDADLITRSIGPLVHHLLEPYQFPTSPTVIANGRLPIGPDRVADVTFNVSGKRFHYWRLNLSDYAADLYWRQQTLSVSNLNAGFYGGHLNWDAAFDFTVRDGADFQFQGTANGANLQLLMSDLTETNSTLEGTLDGNLVITYANSDDWKSWNGFANATVRDGFLWDIPIVGVFSPFFNKVAPGVVSTRANAASGNFQIEKSIIQSNDFEVYSPAMRLQYRGTVDFDGVVNALMQAEIFRDMWAVGRMVSVAFWPLTKVFDFRVTGTLNNPKSAPHFSPRLLLLPFQPLKTMKEILLPTQTTRSLTPLPNRRNGSPITPPKNAAQTEAGAEPKNEP